MKDAVAYVPGLRSDFVELARTTKGRLFRKQILHVGDSFVHPGDPKSKIMVDRAFGDTLRANFKAGYCDIVQVPIVDASNKHVEDPLRNMGEVIDVQVDDKGVYAIIDARKDEYANELGRTLLGASAMLHLNYGDTRTGKKVGPTLLHVAVTNRPYITNLDDFHEIVAASAESMGETPVLLAGEVDDVDLEELLKILKDEHGIDVEALQAKITEVNEESAESESSEPVDSAEEADDKEEKVAASVIEDNEETISLSAAITGALMDSGIVTLSEGETLDAETIVATMVELSREHVSLSAVIVEQEKELEALRLSASESLVDGLVSDGKILPSQRDAMLKLSMSDRETFDALIPAEPIVKMSAEGVALIDEPDSAVRDEMATEVQRYLAEQAPK